MPGLEGTTLGRYRLMRRLGRGGMSEVYLAYDESMHREVAIKVVSGSYADYLARFQREAEAIGRLHHDHILPAYDYGEEGPWHYLVMPYIGHGTLRDRLESGPLTLEDAGEMLEQVASALQAAHDAGIVHRDIKPSNILLRDDHYSYLADFGLAKALEGGNDLTLTGTLLGTPEYMSPELSEGPATTTSDLYALGILLYEMVTGRVPFSGETPIAVYWKQIREQPTPPSRLQPDLPRSIEQIILRSLEKDPSRRYPTAVALAQAYLTALAQIGRARMDIWSAEDRFYQDEMPLSYDTTRIQETDSSAMGTINRPLYYPGGNALPQEEKLVLPGNPLDEPTAIPAARNRSGIRNRISTSFRRNRFRSAASQMPGQTRRGAVWEARETPDWAEDAAAQTIVQPPVRPIPQQSAYPTPPAYPQAGIRPSPAINAAPAPTSRPPQRSTPPRRRRRPSPTYIGGIVGIVVLALLIIGTIIGLAAASHSTNSQQGTATSTVSTNASGTAGAVNTSGTQQAQASATAGVALTVVSGTPTYADPLSSNRNGWSNDGAHCAFLYGTYHVLVQQPNFLQLCKTSAFIINNDAISVNVSLLSGDNVGMIFRVNGTQFYDFEINRAGEFFFRRHDAGTGANYQYLISSTKSSAIASGNAVNNLLVIANGSDFMLYINGTFVGEQQDNTYSSGQIGLVAGTLPTSISAEGSFSNLKVYKVS